MSTELAKYDHKAALQDLQEINEMTRALMQTKHYQKMGDVGVFAIVQKAKALNVGPLEALNGGLYFVQGKVEMSAQMMTQLIRRAGHSIVKDPKSDDTICILHGKRKDNGDTWTESFSMKDAERAGLMKNPTWKSYPRDMMFNRALSRLARQLFPDVIHGCYIENELREEPLLQKADLVETPELISDEMADYLEEKLKNHPTVREKLFAGPLKRFRVTNLEDLPSEHYERTLIWIDRAVAKEGCAEVSEVKSGVCENTAEVRHSSEVVLETINAADMTDDQIEMAFDDQPIEAMAKELGLSK